MFKLDFDNASLLSLQKQLLGHKAKRNWFRKKIRRNEEDRLVDQILAILPAENLPKQKNQDNSSQKEKEKEKESDLKDTKKDSSSDVLPDDEFILTQDNALKLFLLLQQVDKLPEKNYKKEKEQQNLSLKKICNDFIELTEKNKRERKTAKAQKMKEVEKKVEETWQAEIKKAQHEIGKIKNANEESVQKMQGKIDELTNKIQQLEQSLKEKDSVLTTATQEKEELIKEKNSLTIKISELQTLQQAAEDAKASAEKKLTQETEKNQQLSTENATLRAEIETKNSENQTLTENLQQKTTELQKAQTDLSEKADKIVELEKQKSESTTENTELKKKISDLETGEKSLIQQLSSAQVESQKTQTELNKAREEINKKEQELTKVATERDEYKSKYEQLKASVITFLSKSLGFFKSKSKKTTDEQHQSMAATTTHTYITKQLNTISTEIETLTVRNNQLEQKFDQLKANLAKITDLVLDLDAYVRRLEKGSDYQPSFEQVTLNLPDHFSDYKDFTMADDKVNLMSYHQSEIQTIKENLEKIQSNIPKNTVYKEVTIQLNNLITAISKQIDYIDHVTPEGLQKALNDSTTEGLLQIYQEIKKLEAVQHQQNSNTSKKSSLQAPTFFNTVSSSVGSFFANSPTTEKPKRTLEENIGALKNKRSQLKFESTSTIYIPPNLGK